MYRGSKATGENDYAINSVQRAINILKLFVPQNLPLSLIEISTLTGVNKSTILRMVVTLESEGFLKKDEDTKKYSLGINALRIGLSMFDSLDLNKIASERLKKLADTTGLVVQMAILDRYDLILVLKILPDIGFSRTLSSHIGGVMPIWCTGIGRLFLAHMEDENVKQILNCCELTKFTPNTITDIDKIMDIIKSIRKDGFAIANSEHENGILSICYPIYDHTGKMVAGFSASGIRDVITNDDIKMIKEASKEAAMDISREIGYLE